MLPYTRDSNIWSTNTFTRMARREEYIGNRPSANLTPTRQTHNTRADICVPARALMKGQTPSWKVPYQQEKGSTRSCFGFGIATSKPTFVWAYSQLLFSTSKKEANVFEDPNLKLKTNHLRTSFSCPSRVVDRSNFNSAPVPLCLCHTEHVPSKETAARNRPSIVIIQTTGYSLGRSEELSIREQPWYHISNRSRTTTSSLLSCL